MHEKRIGTSFERGDDGAAQSGIMTKKALAHEHKLRENRSSFTKS